MWDEASNRQYELTNNRDQRLSQSPWGRLGVILAVLFLLHGATILYGSTQSPDWMKAWPFALVIESIVAYFYAIAYVILVRKGIFTSFFFLVTYHALLGIITFLHAYLYYLVIAAMRGGAYYPGWVHITAVKNFALNSTIWYAVHIVFLLLAIVVSRITNK